MCRESPDYPVDHDNFLALNFGGNKILRAPGINESHRWRAGRYRRRSSPA
jgi:hypothetical protein